MSLPPVYDLLRQHGHRFHTNARQWTDSCNKCGGKKLFVALDDDGEGFRCHCNDCGFSESARLRPAKAKPEGNGGTPRDDDDAKRRAVEEAKRELGIEPEQEPEQNLEDAFEEARERDFPDDDGAPGDDAEAQRKALEEARREFDDIED